MTFNENLLSESQEDYLKDLAAQIHVNAAINRVQFFGRCF